MKVEKLALGKLRNDEHYEFHVDTKGVIDAMGAETLKIAKFFTPYVALIATENDALRIVNASELTAKMVDADAVRDGIFRGLKSAVRSGLEHFDAQKRAAAERVWLVLENYGDIAAKPYTEETAAIAHLLADASTKLVADITTLGLADWFTELRAKNDAFTALVSGRDTQKGAIPDLNMRDIRIAIDTAYRAMIDQINALILVTGPLVYTPFVIRMNAQIDRYTALLNGRKTATVAKNPAPTPTV